MQIIFFSLLSLQYFLLLVVVVVESRIAKGSRSGIGIELQRNLKCVTPSVND